MCSRLFWLWAASLLRETISKVNSFARYAFVIKFALKILQHKAWYTQSCLQKCLSFQYVPSRRLPVQYQKLEQSVKHVYS